MPKNNKTFRPTRDDRKKVKMMAALGLGHGIIARRFGITEEVLAQHFERELLTALPEMRAMAGAHLFASAKAGNMGSIAFWLKTRAGWSESAYLRERPPDEKEEQKTMESRFYMPCNSRGFCARLELVIPYLEKQLKILLEEEGGT